jgi:Sporulation lipoprotein YhcN/YlaJ (Spore_YhcN_YlaJ)
VFSLIRYAGVLSLCTCIALTGCSTANQESTSLTEPSNVHAPAKYNDVELQSLNNNPQNFGFMQLNSNVTNNTNISEKMDPAIDREQHANTISQLVVQLPDVLDVTTLVTDKEVLIVYETDSKDRYETAEQVKQTALSVMPRYYHAYVSDNVNLTQNIKNFADLRTDSRNINYMIEKTVQQMLKSPQGKNTNDSENDKK